VAVDTETLNLFLIVLFSAIGFGYFIYGKRQQAWVALFSGLLLMVYPYFLSSALGMIAVGLLLVVFPFVAKRLGW
jgi:4-hydroxybenzoate polyprenyltransferase